jgi:hypothetical protein
MFAKRASALRIAIFAGGAQKTSYFWPAVAAPPPQAL